MMVDTSTSNEMEISFGLTFPNIPCPELKVDAMDITGTQRLSVFREVYKRRLDSEGNWIGSAYLGKPDIDDYRIIPGIGLLKLKHGDTAPKLINEGCMLSGHLKVPKVAGNFHIALGKGLELGSGHVHAFNTSDMYFFNCSHTIHYLSFGPDIGKSGSLDGTTHILETKLDSLEKKNLIQRRRNPMAAKSDRSFSDLTGRFEYFVDIVPTSLLSRFGWDIHSHQYSATQRFVVADPEKAEQGHVIIPGVFFMYKIEPFMVHIVPAQDSLLRFLTSICAITGGVITVAGIIDSLIFYCSRFKFEALTSTSNRTIPS